MSSADDITSRLLMLVQRKNSDGSFRYQAKDVKDFLALVLLSTPIADPRNLPAPFKVLMGELAERIGFVPGQGKIQAKLDAYFSKNPPHPELVAELRALVGSSAPAST